MMKLLKSVAAAAIAAVAMTTAATAGSFDPTVMDLYVGRYCYVASDMTNNGKQPDGSIDGVTHIYRQVGNKKCSRDNLLTIRKFDFVDGRDETCHVIGVEKGDGDRHLIAYECDPKKEYGDSITTGHIWLHFGRKSSQDMLIVTHTTPASEICASQCRVNY